MSTSNCAAYLEEKGSLQTKTNMLLGKVMGEASLGKAVSAVLFICQGTILVQQLICTGGTDSPTYRLELSESKRIGVIGFCSTLLSMALINLCEL